MWTELGNGTLRRWPALGNGPYPSLPPRPSPSELHFQSALYSHQIPLFFSSPSSTPPTPTMLLSPGAPHPQTARSPRAYQRHRLGDHGAAGDGTPRRRQRCVHLDAARGMSSASSRAADSSAPLGVVPELTHIERELRDGVLSRGLPRPSAARNVAEHPAAFHA